MNKRISINKNYSYSNLRQKHRPMTQTEELYNFLTTAFCTIQELPIQQLNWLTLYRLINEALCE